MFRIIPRGTRHANPPASLRSGYDPYLAVRITSVQYRITFVSIQPSAAHRHAELQTEQNDLRFVRPQGHLIVLIRVRYPPDTASRMNPHPPASAKSSAQDRESHIRAVLRATDESYSTFASSSHSYKQCLESVLRDRQRQKRVTFQKAF